MILKQLHLSDSRVESSPNVLLLVSVFITDDGLGLDYRLPENFDGDKIDQFLSSLATMTKIPTYEQWFFIEYSQSLKKYSPYIDQYIRAHFSNPTIFSFRLQYYKDWRTYSDRIPKTIKYVLIQGNADHAYLPMNSMNFIRLLEVMENVGDRALGEITHWPESVYYATRPTIRSNRLNGHLITQNSDAILGTTLVTSKLFADFWSHDFTNGSRIVRLDNPFGPSVSALNITRVTPPFEMFRHLDGYGHTGVTLSGASYLRPNHKLTNGEVQETPWSFSNVTKKTTGFDLLKSAVSEDITSKNDLVTYLMHGSSFRVSGKLVYNLIKNSSISKPIATRIGFVFLASTMFKPSSLRIVVEELFFFSAFRIALIIDWIFEKSNSQLSKKIDLIFLIYIRHNLSYLFSFLKKGKYFSK